MTNYTLTSANLVHYKNNKHCCKVIFLIFLFNTLGLRIYRTKQSRKNHGYFGWISNHIAPQLIALKRCSNPQKTAHLQVCNKKKNFVWGFFVSDIIGKVGFWPLLSAGSTSVSDTGLHFFSWSFQFPHINKKNTLAQHLGLSILKTWRSKFQLELYLEVWRFRNRHVCFFLECMFFPGVLVWNFINSSWTFACSYLFERSNRCEHAKGNMQKMGNFQWKKHRKTIIKCKQNLR